MTIRLVYVSAGGLRPNISKTDRNRGSVPKDHQQKMVYGESNGQMTDDVTQPWKVKVMTPICLRPIISTTAGNTDLVSMEHL